MFGDSVVVVFPCFGRSGAPLSISEFNVSCVWPVPAIVQHSWCLVTSFVCALACEWLGGGGNSGIIMVSRTEARFT